jgi:hypothetical protein
MSDNDMELLRSTLLKYMDIHEAKNVISQPSLDLEDLCRFMPADAAKVVYQIQSQRTIEPVFDAILVSADATINEAIDEIANTKSYFSSFKKTKFDDLLTSQKRIKPLAQSSTKQVHNALYFSGASPWSFFLSLDEARSSDEQGAFTELTFSETVSSRYLRHFFSCALGNQYLISNSKLKYPSGFSLDFEKLKQEMIPIPDLAAQEKIIRVADKVELLERQVTAFRNQFSLNPQSKTIIEKVDQMLEIVDHLTFGEKVKSLVHNDESAYLEFKQTFQYCLRENSKQTYVETSCLKTIVGFLNAEGGTLLIGVEDKGNIPGIGLELDKLHKGSKDKYILNLRNKIKDRIGASFFQFISVDCVEVDGAEVLVVKCMPSTETTFLDKKDFYVRQPASTGLLEGPELIRYVATRFQIHEL